MQELSSVNKEAGGQLIKSAKAVQKSGSVNKEASGHWGVRNILFFHESYETKIFRFPQMKKCYFSKESTIGSRR